jgi:hypothetical protein
MQEHKKKAYQNKLQELWGEEMAKAIAEAQARDGGEQDLDNIGGLIG